ncbi:hypothetical protein PV367_33915 [Streptomyces europaeiscabiei]|uniref:Tat pathway signal sequence domain protein n=1 Tax=Streptomyces europaeiscabiei TaxID=146819 RepID=A0AAJ2UQ77_9ACTN|nr:hypothetical protein [Streptomyces europaeiscabiei]MDX3134671.1 hypothetical protein [Streptomyces europaeiscabiei]
MSAQYQPNLTLRRLMAEYGFTREGLAEAVNEAAQQTTGEPGNCSARLVGYWLSGRVSWLRDRSRVPLETVFGRPADELGFRAPASRETGVTVRRRTRTSPQDVPVRRRQFIIGLTGSLLALPPLPESGRLGTSDVDRVKAAAAKLHQIDDLRGGGQLSDVAARYIEYVEDAARRCTYGGSVEVRLHRALGEMATSAGWFAFDAGQQDQARRWWDAGLRYALLGRDRLLQARIWSSMSHQAWQLGHGAEAVSIARAALEETRGRRDGRLSSLLHSRVALGHAVQGESGWCARSLLRAETEFDREPAEPQRWLGFFNAGEVRAMATSCFIDLRQHDKAVAAARESLCAVRSSPFLRNQFAAQVRLGGALATTSELEEAVAVGNVALSLLPEVQSSRIGVRLRQLRDELVDRGAPGAVELSERYEAVVA